MTTPKVHQPWLRDILRISLATVLGLVLTHPLFQVIAEGQDSRLVTFAALAVCGVLTLGLVAVSYKPLALRVFLKLSKASAER